ncbi:class I SAM-dependent methyltransferase [Vampirovibrio chlorellavorus]|uniref:class I SAM-dependent methyltransferase n=1 Tax=Vampirovibrio chlorellavorus TaxID=758823 RepID=UPI0026E97366|nr:class I SAM-dependent methyltransferase [Vampirovibrio chlorellavorus]
MSNRTITITDALYDYIIEQSLREPPVLRELRAATAELGDIKRMQISPEQGQFMALLVQLTGASRLLEVGTFTGYSTLACALALPEQGEIVACDLSAEWTQLGQRYWQQAGVQNKIQLKLGPAAETLKTLLAEGEANRFDMMFIDADKGGYDTYYELGLQLVRPGGLILIDNVLWGGDVVDAHSPDKDTQAIRRLNAKLAHDPRITISLLPIGDGLTLARRNDGP